MKPENTTSKRKAALLGLTLGLCLVGLSTQASPTARLAMDLRTQIETLKDVMSCDAQIEKCDAAYTSIEKSFTLPTVNTNAEGLQPEVRDEYIHEFLDLAEKLLQIDSSKQVMDFASTYYLENEKAVKKALAQKPRPLFEKELKIYLKKSHSDTNDDRRPQSTDEGQL